MELNLITGIVLSLLLIGFFYGLEIAFISANRLNIELRKKQGKRSGMVLSFFAEHPAKFIGTTLVAINLMLVIYGVLVGRLLDELLWKNFPGIAEYSYLVLALDVIIAALMLLFVVFIFKAMFRANNDKIINNSFIIFCIQTLHTMFAGIASFFTACSEWILHYIFSIRIQKNKEVLTRIDLEHFIQQSREHEEDDPEFDTELFENALSLSETRIRQCYIPRKEIEAVEMNTSLEDVRQKFIETKLSKLVVYEQNIDSILGYIHQLDLFKNPATLQSIMLPIPAVPESMSASDLISKFTKERKSIAWVVDEFGGTAGIVTMEDLLEELFGDIHDEYDTEEFVEKQISKDEFIFSGRMELDSLNERYQLEFPGNESETLSGYIIQQHETIPKQKDRIIIGRFEFEILNVSATRIEMVKMRILK
jgi:putative hemolysin